MARLGWAPVSAWQTTGLAELIVGHPQFRNDRDGYRMTVSVSFGPDRFAMEGHQFSARLRAAWLEPEYHNCHPVPGSRPGDTAANPNIEILGGRYHFRGPKPDREFLAGNPFGANAAEDAPETDDPTPSTVPFAEIAWNHPGANWVRLTLSSERANLDIARTSDAKPLSKGREKLIQHYLRMKLARHEAGIIHWARAVLRGKVRE